MIRKELTRDRSGRPIVGCESGKGEVRIFLGAGAHGDEPAGVLAALRLVSRFKDPDDFRFRRVPIRDPAGHVGFLTILSELTGEKPPEKYEELREFIKKHGREIYDDGILLLADYDKVIIAFAPPEDDKGEDAINDRIATAMSESSTVYEELLGRHIFMPANQPKSEGVGLYGRGFTSYVSKSGRLGNYNRFFGSPEAPPEVKAVQEFLDEFKPHYTIDMHEGYDDCFYVVLDELRDGIDYLLARPKVTSLRICSKEELERTHNADAPWDGVIVYKIPDSLAGYATRYGHAITTETGLKAPLQKRITAHMQAFFNLLEVIKIEERVKTVECMVKKAMSERPDDHGWSHVKRVKTLSMRTSKRLGADAFVVYLAALLHDIASEIDRERHALIGAKIAKKILGEVGLEEYAERVAKVIEEHSRGEEPSNKESLALKIADLLDATGYIGAYRAIAYGARKGRDLNGFIKHANEKLLKIYERISKHTRDEEILAEAKRRHEELLRFVEVIREEGF